MHRLFLACLLCSLAASVGTAQNDFFWSSSDLNQGAVNGNLVMGAAVGESRSIFLYYSTNGPMKSELKVGALLDISTSRSDVIRFTAAESFNFEILFDGAPILRKRWEEESGFGGETGNVGTVADDTIMQWGAFTTRGGFGIRRDFNGEVIPEVVDTGFDSGADAFLFGRIDFEVIGPGEVDIVLAPGAGLIVDDETELNPVFGLAQVVSSSDFLLGDVNLDGTVDLLDVAPFVELLANSTFQIEADINSDGFVNLLDIAGFVDLLSGSLTGPGGGMSGGGGSGEGASGSGNCLRGDVNKDNVVDLLDDSPFVDAVLSNEFSCEVDVNQDGEVNLLDVRPFVELIAG